MLHRNAMPPHDHVTTPRLSDHLLLGYAWVKHGRTWMEGGGGVVGVIRSTCFRKVHTILQIFYKTLKFVQLCATHL